MLELTRLTGATSLAILVACNGIVTTDGYRFDRPHEAGGAGAAMGTGGAGASSSTGPPAGAGGGGAGTSSSGCDDFERADSMSVGNGWIEKDEAAFEIVGGELVNTTSGPSDWKGNAAFWGDNDVHELEASMVVRFIDAIEGHPRLLVRAPSLFADAANFVQAYALGISDPTSASLVKQDSNTIGSGFMLTQAIEVGQRVRLTLRIEGVANVVLTSRVEVEDELNAGDWVMIGEDVWNDTNSPMFLDPGVAGVAMNGGSTAVVDDFCVTLL